MKKRILFVDDEPNILQGLKRNLRSLRNEWDMTFTESGQQALEILQQDTFDAIVSDMRMPNMDGAQLLDEVKKRHPEMIRFVLSGHSDQELVMRSLGPSHQYLAKPCEPEFLKSKLADAFVLHKLLNSDAIRGVVAGMNSLPSLPHIYREVVEELQSPDSSIKTVGALIEQDPGMATKVLQLVNSAYFGIGRQIASPAEAANFIGLDILKSLVLSESVFSQFDPQVIKILSPETLKSRSLMVANAARAIAKSETKDQKIIDQSFIAGLLHELGSLILASNLAEDYQRVLEMTKHNEMTIWEAEMQVFGTTHAEVAAYLLGLWGIDDDVVAAVAYYHKPEGHPADKFSALTAVYVAYTCASVKPQVNEEPLFNEEGLGYLQRLGLLDHLPQWQGLCQLQEEDAA